MLFQTFQFALFFSAFLALYFVTKRWLPIQNGIILIGSYIFYGAWDERFLTLIIISTATDYIAGLGAAGKKSDNRTLLYSIAYLLIGSAIALVPSWDTSAQYFLYVTIFAVVLWAFPVFADRFEESQRKKLFVTFSLVANLGLLGIFKYFNFFADSLQSLASVFLYELHPVTLEIVLPVGISFYTFQTLSYSIDIYRGKLKPTRNLLELAAFVSFFPQLVAGPIERASNLLPQIQRPRHFVKTAVRDGATLFVWGLFKKVVIADNLAPIADHAFANSANLGSAEHLAGLLAFTFQIYCDFSGYTDMARGLARILGFNLMLNFNLPYISRTPSEFWLRWHISLSSWLRDYLYISLGGNRNGNLTTYRNLFLTMLLGGLWHGASWTFVLWGAFHGTILIIYRTLKVDALIEKWDKSLKYVQKSAANLFLIAIMFVLTLYGWLIFRAETMSVLVSYTTNLLDFSSPYHVSTLLPLVYYILPLLFIQALQIRMGELEIFWKLPSFVRINIALFVILGIVFLQPRATSAFIYFNF